MPTSEILDLQVLYRSPNKINTRNIVVFHLPVDSELQNPNGTVDPSFHIASNGPINQNDVVMEFTEIQAPGGPSTHFHEVRRTGYATLNQEFDNGHTTAAKLLSYSGTPEKSRTGDEYQEDPLEEFGGDLK
jgi:hypothetical protein